MPSESFPSPNAIPPRTSSSARPVQQHRPSKSVGSASSVKPTSASNGGTSTLLPANNGTPAKSAAVPRPVSEGSWIAPSAHRRKASTSETTIRPLPAALLTDGVVGAAMSSWTGRGADGPGGLDGAGDGEKNGASAAAATGWTAEKEKIIMGPYEYLHDRPGKNIRSQLVSAFNHWLRVPEERLAIVTKVVGMLHTASLLVDDIEDSSVLRRGVPVAHNIFGTAQTLNSANYVYFGALRELLRLGNPKFTAIYCDELCNLHRGQGLDLFWRDTLTCPTEADYLEMVGHKTAGLFRLAVKLMQAESAAERDLVPLVNLMGVIFQIRDDYLNLYSPAYSENKGLCEDLTEGKFSFPIIHAIRADPHNSQLINILKQKPTDPAVKKYATDYMERVGSFAHCRRVVRELVERALAMVAELDADAQGENAEVKSILKHFLLD